MYREIQPASRTLRTVLLVAMGMSVFTTVGVILPVAMSEPGSTWSDVLPVLGVMAVSSGLPIVLFFVRQNFWMDELGVHVVLRPFHWKGRHIPWTEVASARLRRVNALGEFGGWGIRGWPRSKKTGYIWNGRDGLELTLRDGKTAVVSVMDASAVAQELARHRTVSE